MSAMSNLSDVIAAMRRGPAGNAIHEFASELVLEVARSGSFPEVVVSQLREFLAADDAATHKDTWKLLNAVEHFWEDMTADQRAGLLSSIGRLFWSTGQEMLQFQIAESLGEHASPSWIADWAASRLATASAQSRTCVLHAVADACRQQEPGFEPGKPLLDLLTRASRDDVIEVRDEAARALAELDRFRKGQA